MFVRLNKLNHFDLATLLDYLHVSVASFTVTYSVYCWCTSFSHVYSKLVHSSWGERFCIWGYSLSQRHVMIIFKKTCKWFQSCAFSSIWLEEIITQSYALNQKKLEANALTWYLKTLNFFSAGINTMDTVKSTWESLMNHFLHPITFSLIWRRIWVLIMLSFTDTNIDLQSALKHNIRHNSWQFLIWHTSDILFLIEV